MPSIRRRSGGTLSQGDEGLDIMDSPDQTEPATVRVTSAASDVTTDVDALPPDLLNAPVGMDDDLSHALASGPPRRKLPGATAFLASAVLIAGGFLGGVITQKHEGGSSTGTSAAALAAAFRNRGTGTGTGTATRTGAGAGTGTAAGGAAAGGAAAGTGAAAGAGAAGGATVGTVKLVDGNTIYLTASDGSIIKVTTGASTTIKVTKDGKPSDLAPGSTVIVTGTAGSDGVVAATAVTQGGGGFGGAGGFGGRTRTGTGTGTGTGAGAAGGTGGGAGG